MQAEAAPGRTLRAWTLPRALARPRQAGRRDL